MGAGAYALLKPNEQPTPPAPSIESASVTQAAVVQQSAGSDIPQRIEVAKQWVVSAHLGMTDRATVTQKLAALVRSIPADSPYFGEAAAVMNDFMAEDAVKRSSPTRKQIAPGASATTAPPEAATAPAPRGAIQTMEEASPPAAGYGAISPTTGLPRTEHVNGYVNKNGTYVAPYYRSRR